MKRFLVLGVAAFSLVAVPAAMAQQTGRGKVGGNVTQLGLAETNLNIAAGQDTVACTSIASLGDSAACK
jgi:hypothetical protein